MKQETQTDTKESLQKNLQTPLPKLLGSKLTTYYIGNTKENNQLEKLLGIHGNTEKIVFQFVLNEEGLLTLAAFSGKKHHRNFRRTSIMFNVGEIVNSTDLTGKNVYFGDEEISEIEDSDEGVLGILRQYINKSGYEYIIFVPTLVLTTSSPNSYYVEFDIGYSSSPHGFIDKSISFNIASPNPCPPHNGY